MSEKVATPPQVDPLLGLDASTLYWHIFCHCTERKIAFCGGLLAEATDQVGGFGDGGEGTRPIEEWDGMGEFCSLCVAQVGNTCPWGCRCGECRALEARSKWWRIWEKRRSPFE